MTLRRAGRDLRQMGARAILVVLAIALAAGTGSGASLTSDNVEEALHSFYSKYHLADVEMTLRKLGSQADLMAHARRAGATRASTRLVFPGTIAAKGVPSAAALFVGMPPDTPLNQLQMLEGKGLGQLGKRGVVIEVDFARTHHLSLGSKLDLEVSGLSTKAKVEGIGRTPDSLAASADPSYFVPQRGSLAYVYAPLKEVQKGIAAYTESADAANVLLVDLPRDRPAARKRLVHGEPVYQLIPRDQQFGYRATQLNLDAVSSFTPVLATVLASVAILLIAVTMMRLVHAQRREMGTMLALGHKRSAVILTAVLPALTLGLLGGLLAIPACMAVAKLMATQFTSSYGFLAVPTKLTVGAAVLAVALAVGTSLLSVVFPAVALSRLTPTEARRGSTPASHRLPGWVRRVTGTVGTPWAYGLRNVLRTPVRSALTVLSLAGAIGLGISLHIVSSSVQAASDTWFAKQPWTETAVLQEPTAEADARRLGKEAGARRVETLVDGAAELMAGSKRLATVNVVGAPPAPQLQSIGLPAEGLRPHSVYVSKQLAIEFGLKVGQRVMLVGPEKQISAVIAGTANTLAEENSYLPLDTAQRLLGQQGKVDTLLVEGGAETGSALRDSFGVAKVVSKATVKSGLDHLISELTLLMNTVVAIGLAVGALFLISSLAMSVLERQAEFAVLRSLGWGLGDMARVVIAESLVLTTGGALVGSLIAPAFASPLMDSLNSAWFQVGYDLRAANFLLVVTPALVLAVLIALQATWRIARLDISKAARAQVAS